MKKPANFLTLAMLVLSLTVPASNDPKPKKVDVKEEITKLLSNPQIQTEGRELTATVEFIVNKNREMVVISVASDNDLIESYIKARLNYKKLEDKNLYIGKTYTVPVRVLANKG